MALAGFFSISLRDNLRRNNSLASPDAKARNHLKMSKVFRLRLQSRFKMKDFRSSATERDLNNFEFKYHGCLLITVNFENKFLIVLASSELGTLS